MWWQSKFSGTIVDMIYTSNPKKWKTFKGGTENDDLPLARKDEPWCYLSLFFVVLLPKSVFYINCSCHCGVRRWIQSHFRGTRVQNVAKVNKSKNPRGALFWGKLGIVIWSENLSGWNTWEVPQVFIMNYISVQVKKIVDCDPTVYDL